MRFIYKLFVISIVLGGCVENNRTFLASEISIIPKPVSETLSKESFAINNNTSISISNNEQNIAANHLIDLIKSITKHQINLKENETAAIVFIENDSLEPEAYQLTVTPKKITISANDASGYFYGVQTINQLLTKHSLEKSKYIKWFIP